MREELTPIEWIGDSRDRIRSFPKPVREQLGFELESIQRGLAPHDWRPMPVVGRGVAEIRVHGENEYRVLYVARFRSAVYVLHAFVKRSQKTPTAAIHLAKARYQEAIRKETLRP